MQFAAAGSVHFHKIEPIVIGIVLGSHLSDGIHHLLHMGVGVAPDLLVLHQHFHYLAFGDYSVPVHVEPQESCFNFLPQPTLGARPPSQHRQPQHSHFIIIRI